MAGVAAARVVERAALTLSLLLALAATTGRAGAQTPDPTPSGPCVVAPAETAATFADANLAAAVRTALALPEGAPLTCGRVATLTELEATGAGIASLQGIESLTGLTRPDLGDNRISDLRPLAGLTGLTFLGLRGNQIVDIAPLANLTGMIDLNITYNQISDLSALRSMRELTTLRLYNNPISDIAALEGLTELHEVHIHDLPRLSDIQPLLNNPGVGEGDKFPLFNSAISCEDVAALRAKGVSAGSTCVLQAIGAGRWAIILTALAALVGFVGYRRRARTFRSRASTPI